MDEARDQERYRLSSRAEFVAQLLESAPDGILVVDGQGTILLVNPETEKMFGYTAQELIGQPIELLVPERYRQVHETHRAHYLGNPRRRSMGVGLDIFARRRDGSEFPADITLGPKVTEDGLNVLVFVRDATALRAADQAARKWGWVFHSSKWGIVVVDNDTNTIQTANPAFEAMHGYEPGEMAGMVWSEIVPYDRVDFFMRQAKIVVEQGRHEYECVHLRKDGSTFLCFSAASVLTDENGRVVLRADFCTDVTEHRALQDQFLRAQKMEAIGRLAGGVAHDFNNLLTVIIGYADLMDAGTEQSDPRKEQIRQIARAARSAAELTRRLLVFAKQQVAAPQTCDLGELVLGLETMLRRLIGEDIRLRTSTSPRLWKVLADPGQLEQVLVNLVVNSRDALPRGGEILIEVANVTLDENYASTHANLSPGQYVMLAVTDNGTGIPPEVQAHLFEPFFTTKDPGKGTGLGLSTCYGIVKQAGGHIWVYSEHGSGTTVKVYLPRATADVGLPDATPSGSASPNGTETVLLVEDRQDLLELAKTTLESLGYKVITASSGFEAIEAARRFEGHIHLLLTDMVLPQMSGKSVAEAILLERPDLRILFVSGYTEGAVLSQKDFQGRAVFLAKPFSPSQLARAVRQAIEGHATSE